MHFMQTGLVGRSHIPIWIFNQNTKKKRKKDKCRLANAGVSMSLGTLFRFVHVCVRIILN